MKVGLVKKTMIYKNLMSKVDLCSMCHIKNSVEINRMYGSTYGYHGERNSSVMICGLAPSYIRRESKYPLSRDYDDLTVGIMFKVLDEIKWPINKTYFTNLIKCSLDKNEFPDNSIIHNCVWTWFAQEVFLVNPLAIIALGKGAKEILDQLKISVPVYEVYHFSYICRNQNLYENWKESWKKIASFIKNNELKERKIR